VGDFLLLLKEVFIIENYSSTLSDILQNKIGYRSDDYGGSGIADAEEVVRFEMDELNNRDIPDFCQREYGLIFHEDNWEEWIESLLVFLRKKLNTENVFVLWVTNQENIGFYCDCEGMNLVSCYALPKNLIPISDLGDEGVLLAMDTHPDFLDIRIEEMYTKKPSWYHQTTAV
jgi:hypothetical protein